MALFIDGSGTSYTNILVSGYNGHMGKILCRLIYENPKFQVVFGVDSAISGAHSFLVSTRFEDSIKEDCVPDVIIDFSSPDGAMEALEFACHKEIPIVIATTGLSNEDFEKIRKASNHIPVFQSYNMSIEVALLRKALQLVASQLTDSDIEIVETHHNRKKDAPSGTALLLADAINSALPNPKNIIYGRTGKRESDEIGISAVRGGNIVGTHTVSFFGNFETLEITHTAHSRELFAEGALKAAEFLLKKEVGLYTMDNLMS